jgi:hypothetical protein
MEKVGEKVEDKFGLEFAQARISGKQSQVTS